MSKKPKKTDRYKELDYADDISVDRDNLDLEWLEQPTLIFKYAEAVANAKSEYEHMKRKEAVVRAEIALDARESPENYDLEKVTEATIKEAVECSEEVCELYADLIRKQHEVAILQGAAKAIDVKKSALENLVRLHGQNYFSTPQATMEDAEVLTDSRKERNAQATKRQRRIRK